MQILNNPIAIEELKTLANNTFGDFVKAVIDIEQNKIAIDAELHCDLESILLDDGSKQNNLWGINFYPDIKDDDFIEFDSMINMRPSQGNMSRSVDSKETQQIIRKLVSNWIKK